ANIHSLTVVPLNITVLDEKIRPYWKEKGIFLIGIDGPSIDPANSKESSAHHSLHKNNVHILENLMLGEVEPGDYELIALPLAIVGADGSPVRAVIRPMK